MKTLLAEELIFPSEIKCIACGVDIGNYEKYCFCKHCKSSEIAKRCKRCGRELNNESDYCEECKYTKWNFSSAYSALNFEKGIKDAIYKFKYNGEKYLSNYFSEYLFDAYNKYKLNADIITFVPIHKKRYKIRGYNQAELLALGLGKLINKPVSTLLVKTKHTKNMARLNKEERKKLIKDSFDSVANIKRLEQKSENSSKNEQKTPTMSDIDIKNKRILLIDDVFTTGSTVDECSRLLKKEGCLEVIILTLASLRILSPLEKQQRIKKIKSKKNSDKTKSIENNLKKFSAD